MITPEQAEALLHSAVDYVGSANYGHRIAEAHEMVDQALSALSSAETAEPDKELQLARLEAFAGQSGQAHLAQRLDEAVELAAEAIELMARFHSHAQPDDTPDMNAIFPALHFKNFVDDHARLMFKLNQFQRNPVDPAFLRLKKAADLVCAVMGAHGEISARDDRVSDLMDCLYATDPLKSVYVDDVAAPQQAAQPEPAGVTDEFPPLPCAELSMPLHGLPSVHLYTADQMRERDVMWQTKTNDLLSRSKELERYAARYRFLRPMLKFDFSTHRTDPHKDTADLVDEYLDAEIAAEQLNTTREK
jgi:hypothetical protein